MNMATVGLDFVMLANTRSDVRRVTRWHPPPTNHCANTILAGHHRLHQAIMVDELPKPELVVQADAGRGEPRRSRWHRERRRSRRQFRAGNALRTSRR